MPWSTSFAGLSAKALGWASSAISHIYDNFARVTSGSLGNATSGQLWTAVDGVWYANSGVAQAASAPSTYPAAGFGIDTDASASVVSPSPGAGIMVWETDSGDWWGAATYVTETSTPTYGCIPNSCCTTYSTCVSNSCCTTQSIEESYATPATCPAGGTIGTGCVFSHSTTGGGLLNCFYTGCCVANSCCTGSPTGGCNSNTCCTTYVEYTTYQWQQFLTIIQSVAAAVSTVATSSNLGSLTNTTGTYPGPLVNSLNVVTLGTLITANAYSDTGFADLVGNLATSNPSTPTGTGVGILLIPSPGVQGTTVGPFSAS